MRSHTHTHTHTRRAMYVIIRIRCIAMGTVIGENLQMKSNVFYLHPTQ